MGADVAGIPSLLLQVDPALDGQAQSQFAWTERDLTLQGSVLRALTHFDLDWIGRQRDLAAAVDVGILAGGAARFVGDQLQIPADVLVGARGKFGEPAKGCEIVPLAVEKANPHGGRLAGGGIVDANMNGMIWPAHWYCAPT